MYSFKDFLLENAMSYDEALKILSISRSDAGDADKLKTAYRVASRKNHPDLGGSEEAMKKVNAANEVLSKGNRGIKNSFDRSSYESYKAKEEAFLKVVKQELEKKLVLANFVSYFGSIFNEQFSFDTKTEISKGRFVYSRTEFYNQSKSTIIDLYYSISMYGIDLNKPMLGISGMTLNTFVENAILHDRRKYKMKKSNWEFSKNDKIFSDPTILFPEKKLKKMIQTKASDKKVARKDFILTLSKELGLKHYGDNTYKMNLSGGYYLVFYRVTMMRLGMWGIQGLYQNKGLPATGQIKVVFFHENAKTLDFMADEFKPLLKMSDGNRIVQDIGKIIEKYKTNE